MGARKNSNMAVSQVYLAHGSVLHYGSCKGETLVKGNRIKSVAGAPGEGIKRKIKGEGIGLKLTEDLAGET